MLAVAAQQEVPVALRARARGLVHELARTLSLRPAGAFRVAPRVAAGGVIPCAFERSYAGAQRCDDVIAIRGWRSGHHLLGAQRGEQRAWSATNAASGAE